MPTVQRLFNPRDQAMIQMRGAFERNNLPPIRKSEPIPNHFFKHYTYNHIPDVFRPLLDKLQMYSTEMNNVDRCSALRIECNDGRPVHVPAIKGRAVFCVMRENVVGGVTVVRNVDPLKESDVYQYEIAPGDILILDEDADLYSVTSMKRIDCDFVGYRDVIILNWFMAFANLNNLKQEIMRHGIEKQNIENQLVTLRTQLQQAQKK